MAAGRTIRLDCLVTGSPSPAVYWTREEGRLIWWLTGPPAAATGLPELAESSNSNSSFHNISTVTYNNNSYMARNRSLVIANATRANSGHYFCVGVNTAGAAMERSHLLVYDEQDFVRPRPTEGADNSSSADAVVDDQYYHVRPDPELASARAALMERTVAVAGLYADSPTSLRISWRLEAAAGPQQQQYLEGYYIYYREAAAAAASSAASVTNALTSVKVLHAGATSYSLNRLRVHTEYEVFIAPFYKSVLGLPSASRLARTSEDWPSAAPLLTNLSLAGAGGGGGGYLSVAWLPLDAEKANGMLAGYRLRIASSSLGGGKGDVEATTLVVSPSETVARIDLNSLQLMGPNGGGSTSSGLVTVSVEVAALNSVGQGPFSPPASLQLDLDRLLRQRKEAADSGGDGSSSSYGEEDFTQGIALDASPAWVGALIGSALLVIVLIGGAILTYRRRLQQAGKMPPPPGGHHHHHHHLAYLEKLLKKPRRVVSHGGSAPAEDRKEQGEIVSSSSLWIDRRWTAAEDCPGGCTGNNLDRRLLGGVGGGQPVENEYTYIDRTKLATFAAAAAAAAATGGGHYSQSRGGESAGCGYGGGYGGESAGCGYGGGGRDHLDLAPYASTDILREEALGSAAFYSTRYLVSFLSTVEVPNDMHLSCLDRSLGGVPACNASNPGLIPDAAN